MSEFRKDPIPRIVKISLGHYFRCPRTKQELTENEAYPEFIRGKRLNIPTDRNDLHRSDSDNRSWKKFRKTQYK